MEQKATFIVRVYGVVIQNGSILVSDEWYQHVKYTKLPGGSMENGEGPEDALRREFREELGEEIDLLGSLHIHPDAIVSSLAGHRRTVCLYFHVAFLRHFEIAKWAENPLFQQTENSQHLYWVPIEDVKESLFSFPSEKGVVEAIKRLR